MTEPTQGPAMGADQVRRLGDRYEVGGLLGRGGMADVRVGRDLRLGRTVAIKRLRNDLASDPTFQARFRREAQSAASLNHPSIVAVYDTGEEIGPDGQSVPYIVMELVEGQTLREILREDRKIMPQRALEITADVLNALDYSHRAGIVHRDIKPANVMLTPAGQVKVMDFGIARAIADSSSAMTQTAAVVGTAQYLSPEQARGEQVDARSDIYSTGCLLFELLTGRPPFIGDSPVSVAYQHVREEPPSPSSINPEVTPTMDAVVARALAKRTEDRYQSAAEMRSDIERTLAGAEIAAPTVAVTPTQAVPMGPPPSDATSTIPATTLPPSSGPPPEERRRRRWPWILLVVLIVLAIIAGGAYAFRDQLGFGDSGGDSNTVKTTQVPNVHELTLKEAKKQLRLENLEPGGVTRKSDEDVAKFHVIETDPGTDEEIDEGEQVDLVVSTGPATEFVPQVIGKPVDEAYSTIHGAGFPDVRQESEPECARPKDMVCKVIPGGQGNKKVSLDDTITIYYSLGYKQVPPDVVGMPERRARIMFSNRGFDPNNIETELDPDSTEPSGTVTDVSESPGDWVDPSDPITITVSDAPEDDPSDDPTDGSSDEDSDDPSDDTGDEQSDDPSDEQESEAPSSPSTDDSTER